MFYALTGLHAVHVLGGLVPLAIVTVAAYQGMYGRKKHAAVRYTAIYWHFLAVVWCAVFTVVYLLSNCQGGMFRRGAGKHVLTDCNMLTRSA